MKRSADIALSAIALVLLAPLFLLVACAIRLTDRGCILYRQTRVGLGGRCFEIVKFRSMEADAERDFGPIWSVREDPRCTPVGYLLRRFGLDELPQLWNILRGEMSLVGPRPERPQFTKVFAQEYPGYPLRHDVRPGLTGFAQVYGWRGCTSLEMRLRHDLYYVENGSLWLDAKILMLTLVRGWSEQTHDAVGSFRRGD